VLVAAISHAERTGVRPGAMASSHRNAALVQQVVPNIEQHAAKL
jgi:hypothetical protein